MRGDEVLIDHTTLHALRKGPVDRETLDLRALGLLQLVEHLLLFETIWVSTFDSASVLDESHEIFELFHKFGMADTAQTAPVRWAQVTREEYRRACRRAAPKISDRLHCASASKLRDEFRAVKLADRPSGAQELGFSKVASIVPESDAAHSYIEKAMETKGWEKVGCVPLLHAPLHRQVKDLVEQVEGDDDIACRQLNVVMRCELNAALAMEISSDAVHSPAFGRGFRLEKRAETLWRDSRGRMEKALNPVLRRYGDEMDMNELISWLGPTLDSEVPLFGIWLLLKLPENCTREQLLEQIALERGKSGGPVRKMGHLLATTHDDTWEEACREVEKELLGTLPRSARPVRPPSWKRESKMSVKLPFGLFQYEWSFKKAEETMNAPFRDWFVSIHRKMLLSEQALVLTGFVEALLNEAPIYDKIRQRVASLIQEGTR